MKKLALAFLIATSIASPAFASDGTVTISGTIDVPTCTVNSGAGDFTVALPTVSANEVQQSSNGRKIAGKTSFTISLIHCAGASRVRANFENTGTVVDALGMVLKNRGSGKNVGVRITNYNDDTDSNGTVVTAGDNSKQGAFAAIVNGAATLRYAAHYVLHTTAAVTPGSVATSITYKLEYQ